MLGYYFKSKQQQNSSSQKSKKLALETAKMSVENSVDAIWIIDKFRTKNSCIRKTLLAAIYCWQKVYILCIPLLHWTRENGQFLNWTTVTFCLIASADKKKNSSYQPIKINSSNCHVRIMWNTGNANSQRTRTPADETYRHIASIFPNAELRENGRKCV